MMTDKNISKIDRRPAAIIAAMTIAVMIAFSVPFLAGGAAEDDTVLGDATVRITGKTVGEIEADIQDAIDGSEIFGEVYVEGRMTAADTTLTLNIYNHVHIYWGAVYEASCAVPALVIDNSTGIFEVISRGSLTLTNTTGDTALVMNGSEPTLYTTTGGTLTVNGKVSSTGDKAHILVAEAGKVTLNGDVTATGALSLEAHSIAAMTVTGDIDAKDLMLYTNSNVKMTVNGNIKVKNVAHVSNTYGDNLTITGNIEVTGDNGYMGIFMSGASAVIGSVETSGVNGNIHMNALNGSTLTVAGSVTANRGDIRIICTSGSTMTVGGNVTGVYGELDSIFGSKLAIKGDVVLPGASQIISFGGSALTIGGNIDAGATYVSAYNGSTMAVGGNVSFNEDNGRIASYAGSTLTINGNVTANENTNSWLITADGAKAIIGGNAETRGNGVLVCNGGLAVIKKELTTGPGNYISVDGAILTKDDFSEENSGPYGGREYTNGNVTDPSSYVYVNVPEDEEKGSSAMVVISLAIVLAVLLSLFALARKKRSS
jgi:hypothetical protein